MRRGVGELVGASRVPCRIDVRKAGFEPFVRFDDLPGRNAELLESVAGEPGGPADGNDDVVETDPAPRPLCLDLDPLLAVGDAEREGTVPGQDRDTIGREGEADRLGHILVLADQEARQRLHLRHGRPQAGEALRQLAADRPAAEHHEPTRGSLAPGHLLPERIRRQRLHGLDTGKRRHDGRGAGGEDDGSGRQAVRPPVCPGDLDRPGIDEPGVAPDHLDPETLVACGGVMGFDGGDHVVDAREDEPERDAGFDAAEPVMVRVPHLMGETGGPDQRLGRDAAVVQAIAAHPVLLEQHDAAPEGGGGGGDGQAARACANDADIGRDVLDRRGRELALGGLRRLHDVRSTSWQRPGSGQRGRSGRMK